jgi:hypothetical protein
VIVIIFIFKSISETTSTQPARLALSFVATIVLMTLMLSIMLHFMHENIHSEEIYGTDSYLKYYPLAMYSILPVISPYIFEPMAALLNEFEAHSTKVNSSSNRSLCDVSVCFHRLKQKII